MPREFKYDILQLIRCVKERPCIWDKTLESHKDRTERKAAWIEVFTLLEPRYEQMSDTEKKATGDQIIGKWTNTRDTFVKSLRTKFGKPKRKYMLHNQMKFLMKSLKPSDHGTNSEDADCSSTEFNDDGMVKYEEDSEEPEENEEPDYSQKRQKRNSGDEMRGLQKSKEYDKNENLDFVEITEGQENDPRIMNEDEAFFASLLPSVVRYTEDERLEFRIEVLAVMRRIKENRKWITRHN